MKDLSLLGLGRITRILTSQESLWLERDDDTALIVRGRWRSRALRRAEMFDDFVDFEFAEKVEYARKNLRGDPALGEMRQQSHDDAKDRPWLHAKPIYPMGVCDGGPEWYAAALVASLTLDPPKL